MVSYSICLLSKNYNGCSLIAGVIICFPLYPQLDPELLEGRDNVFWLTTIYWHQAQCLVQRRGSRTWWGLWETKDVSVRVTCIDKIIKALDEKDHLFTGCLHGSTSISWDRIWLLCIRDTHHLRKILEWLLYVSKRCHFNHLLNLFIHYRSPF